MNWLIVIPKPVFRFYIPAKGMVSYGIIRRSEKLTSLKIEPSGLQKSKTDGLLDTAGDSPAEIEAAYGKAVGTSQ